MPPSPWPVEAATPNSGARLASHLAVIVAVKIVALTLLWALFFRAGP